VSDNTDLNLNAARPDRFFLRFGIIPSLPLLSPPEASNLQKIILNQNDKEYFHLALKGVDMPGVSLEEIKIDTTYVPLADTTMKFTYEPLVTEIKLDSNYVVYKTLLFWLFLTKHPQLLSNWGSSIKNFQETTTQATLIITDNFKNPILSFDFYELRPLSLPTIPFSYKTEGEEMTMQVTWSYSYYLPKTAGGKDFNFSL
jgi:hypothetical protein